MTTNDWIRIIIAIAFIAVIFFYGLARLLHKKAYFSSKMIAATGVLTAIEIVLQIVGNFITIGPVSINLSLIPIALGAILYGPICGAFLGVINGLTVIFAPSTIAVFMPINPLATILVCLLKSTCAGIGAAYLYRLFKNKNATFAAIIASMSVPVINTGLFAVGSLLFFMPFLDEVAKQFPNIYAALFLGVIGWNFIFEFLANSLLSPAISRIVTITRKSYEN